MSERFIGARVVVRRADGSVVELSGPVVDEAIEALVRKILGLTPQPPDVPMVPRYPDQWENQS